MYHISGFVSKVIRIWCVGELISGSVLSVWLEEGDHVDLSSDTVLHIIWGVRFLFGSLHSMVKEKMSDEFNFDYRLMGVGVYCVVCSLYIFIVCGDILLSLGGNMQLVIPWENLESFPFKRSSVLKSNAGSHFKSF